MRICWVTASRRCFPHDAQRLRRPNALEEVRQLALNLPRMVDIDMMTLIWIINLSSRKKVNRLFEHYLWHTHTQKKNISKPIPNQKNTTSIQTISDCFKSNAIYQFTCSFVVISIGLIRWYIHPRVKEYFNQPKASNAVRPILPTLWWWFLLPDIGRGTDASNIGIIGAHFIGKTVPSMNCCNDLDVWKYISRQHLSLVLVIRINEK